MYRAGNSCEQATFRSSCFGSVLHFSVNRVAEDTAPRLTCAPFAGVLEVEGLSGEKKLSLSALTRRCPGVCADHPQSDEGLPRVLLEGAWFVVTSN